MNRLRGAWAAGAVAASALAWGCSGDNSTVSTGTTGSGSFLTTTGQGGAGGATSSTDAGVGGGFSTGSGPMGTCEVAAAQKPNATCKLQVTLNNFTVSNETCFVDVPFKDGDQGQLNFACGQGPATLDFPGGSFVGTSDSCNVNLTRITQYPFSDGCIWETKQTVVGKLDGQLVYKYTEKPVKGSNCAMACTVDAVMNLESMGPVEVENPK